MWQDLLPPGLLVAVPEAVFTWVAARPRGLFAWVERQVLSSGGLEPDRAALVLGMRSGAPARVYRPLEWPELFLKFAAVDPTPEGCLAFADRYGPLGDKRCRVMWWRESEEGRPDVRPILYPDDWKLVKRLTEALDHETRLEEAAKFTMERFDDWRNEVVRMRHLTGLWRAVEAGDQQALARHVAWKGGRVVHRFPAIEEDGPIEALQDDWGDGELVWGDDVLNPGGKALFRKGDVEGPARLFVQREVNRKLKESVWPQLFWSVERGRSELTYVPRGLLAAMYVQFAQAVNGPWRFQLCAVCKEPFQVSRPRGGARTDKTTCTPNCRMNLYRQRQAQARELSRQGKTPKAIAKALGAELEVVKKWIAKGG
jgi:hypothetical protein